MNHAIPIQRFDPASWRSMRRVPEGGIPIRTAREVADGLPREEAVKLLYDRMAEVRECIARLDENANADSAEEYQQQRTRMVNIIHRLRTEVERVNTMSIV